MPTYEYLCRSCDARFEIVQSFADSALTKCPQVESSASPEACLSPGKGEVKKVYFAPSITFKGEGFYKTDSRAASVGASRNGESKGSGSDKPDSDKAEAGAKGGSGSGGSGSESSGGSGGQAAARAAVQIAAVQATAVLPIPKIGGQISSSNRLS